MTESPTTPTSTFPIAPLLLAFGGVVLLAIALLSSPREEGGSFQLLASAQAGGELEIREAPGPVTIYVSGAGGVGPQACSVTEPADARIVPAAASDTRIGETRLYAVGTLEDFSPPGAVTCSAAGVADIYAGTDGGGQGGGPGLTTLALGGLGVAGLAGAAYLTVTGRRL